MNASVIRQAIKELQDEVDQLMLEAKKKKQAINTLHETLGEKGPYEIEGEPNTLQLMRPDLFYGKPFATAVQEFMNMEKRACSVEEIIQGLERGGFNFPWAESDRVRIVGMSLTKNSLFHKLPNGTFGLLSWYPNIPKTPRRVAKTDSETNEQVEIVQTDQDNAGSVEDSTEEQK